MPLAQIGPLTNLIEGVATAIGAGMLLGGFATGLVGLVGAWPKRLFDSRVLQFSYGGGAVSVMLLLADITFHNAF